MNNYQIMFIAGAIGGFLSGLLFELVVLQAAFKLRRKIKDLELKIDLLSEPPEIKKTEEEIKEDVFKPIVINQESNDALAHCMRMGRKYKRGKS